MRLQSALHRAELLHKLQQEPYDLVVIGGGITGAGIALDAASRGLKTALVEQNDFASGTSSSSTKLIHGGLRYLKQFEVALVRETGRERAVVHKLAPHLVKPEKMLLPLIKGGSYGKIIASLGLMIYDVLAGVEKADQRKMLTPPDTLKVEPLIRPDLIEGGGLYAEYRTDDARLTIEVIKTATQYGAHCCNYVKALEFTYNQANRITGLQCQDQHTGQTFTINSKYVVSAAGPWVDELRKINQSLEGKQLHLTKGVHLVVPHKRFPVGQAIYFDVPDGRMIFAIPRGKITYIGTTDTDYSGDINDVRTNMADVQYLLDGVNHSFPKVALQRDDIVSSWAGLRPLINEMGKSASEISRKDEIFESETGLISIAGGKLTGYRKMAERIVNLVSKKIKAEHNQQLKPCHTEQIVLTGGPFEDTEAVHAYTQQVAESLKYEGITDPHHASYLVSNYGKQTEQITDRLARVQASTPAVKLALAELDYCMEHELTSHLADFLVRRSGRIFFWIDSIPEILAPLANAMATRLGWSEAEKARQLAAVQTEINRATVFE